ncbi:MAG TPA: M48 family metallopeptidase [Terriglobales bacterium]|jgi:STE24 endopeptidase|nr:M48 family metallopeptidase [Terriglobales bacterium]
MTAVEQREHKPDTPQARAYNRIRRRLSLMDAALGFVLLVLLLAMGWSKELRDVAVRLAGAHYALALLVYIALLAVLAKLAGLPLDLYSFRLEHRYQLSNQKLGSWAWDGVKSLLVSLVLGGILAELIYFVLRRWPEHWWLIAWGVFLALFVFFAQIAPVVLFPLFYKFKPLEDQELKERLLGLSERAGTRVRGVYEWKLSEKSKKANAALVGLGRTRRIILADTLLAGYSADEIESILAHELGHHVHRHIPKSIVVEAGISLFGFWAAGQVLALAVARHWFASLDDFANLPLLLLVSSALSLLLMPAMNAYSRSKEREADRYALDSTGKAAPFISSMNKLAEQNLAEREPKAWVEWLFHSHPAISKRIAAAEDWEKARTSAAQV